MHAFCAAVALLISKASSLAAMRCRAKEVNSCLFDAGTIIFPATRAVQPAEGLVEHGHGGAAPWCCYGGFEKAIEDPQEMACLLL